MTGPVEIAAPEISVDRAATEIVRPVGLAFEALVVRDASPALDAAIGDLVARIRQGATLPDESLAAVRAMYRRMGIDPTKIRPSSEALLRRVRRGDPLPRINTLVDVINWCSLERQLPYGLYDLDTIESRLVLRLGREDEEYAGIRKDVVHVGGRLTLADAQGPFGNPTSDSWRTRVTTGTTRALVVIFAPAALPPRVSEQASAITRDRVAEYSS